MTELQNLQVSLLRFDEWEPHGEGRAAVLWTVHCNPSAMEFSDCFGDGQSQTGSLCQFGLGILAAEETVEDVRQFRSRDTGPRICDTHCYPGMMLYGVLLGRDRHLSTRRTEGNGIFYEPDQHLRDVIGID